MEFEIGWIGPPISFSQYELDGGFSGNHEYNLGNVGRGQAFAARSIRRMIAYLLGFIGD